MGEEERLPVVQEADAEGLARRAGGVDIGHLVLGADVVVAVEGEQPALTALGAPARREKLEHHGAERRQTGVDVVALGRDLEVELESDAPDEVVDGRLVAVDDGVDVVQLDELQRLWGAVSGTDQLSHRLPRRPKAPAAASEGGGYARRAARSGPGPGVAACPGR